MHRRGKHRPTHQKQRNAAEHDRRNDPALIRPLQLRLLHPQHNQAHDSQEVEEVARHAVESRQRREIAHDDINHRNASIEQHSEDGRVEETLLIRHPTHQFPASAGGRAARETHLLPAMREADVAEEGGDVAFSSGGVDEAAGGEGGGVEGAEAGARDGEGQQEGADGAEDGGAEGDGHGVRGVDYFVWQDEDVAEVCEEVGEDYEGEAGVDCAWEVAGRVDHFAHDVVGVVPAVVGPEAGVEGDGPLAA